MKLSIVIATKNEEKNIGDCLESVSKIANEIIIVDEYSTDNTVKTAEKFGAKIYKNKHKKNFHESKEFGIQKAKGEWILQLDADERVTPSLATEIQKVINSTNEKLLDKKIRDSQKRRLFMRHQKKIEARDGEIGRKTNEIVGFFIPRMNYFLGKPLIHAGVYPDAVIRLVKNGKAHLPAISVHEQIILDGEVSWLEHDLLHYDSPTLTRYINRLDRYTTLQSKDFGRKKNSKSILFIIHYSLVIPVIVFLKLFVRHKGYKDGVRGFLWSAFSASHWAIAYWKYWNVK